MPTSLRLILNVYICAYQQLLLLAVNLTTFFSLTLLSLSSIRLFSLLVLSIVLISPVEEGVQGIIAVLAVLLFVFGFALGLGAGELCLFVGSISAPVPHR